MIVPGAVAAPLRASSYLSQSDLRIFFGLGTKDRIDALRVRRRDGGIEEVRDVKARQHLTLVQGQGLRR